jgi:DNA-binding GntR family transcriptional regulator
MDSKALNMNKQITTGKRKHGSLIPQKIEIIRRFGSSEN